MENTQKTVPGTSERDIILASGSPRRLELMSKLGFRPQVVVSAVPEERSPDETPLAYTRRLARDKAEAVRDQLAKTAKTAQTGQTAEAPAWILAADTIVVLGGPDGALVVLEKPANSDEAHAMLRRLSGRIHTVQTSFCWLNRHSGQAQVESVRADVEFRELTDTMIARYIATGEPADKAGAYGIQDVGSALVRRVDGSYFAVVGLPVCEVVETLQELGGLREFPW